MKVLVCTGGIGSGKSYVVRIFEKLGIHAYDSDSRAKALYDEDCELLKNVARLAGSDVLKPDGSLDRTLFASRIFSDSSLLSKVEELVHPAVVADFNKWMQCQTSDFVIFESAIFLQKPCLAHLADKVLTVTAPKEARLERAQRRDKSDAEAVRRRMASQWSDEELIAKSDFVIVNDGTCALLPQILEVIEKMKD